MEPTRETLSPEAPVAGAWGELIVQNGRLAGTRHPLEAPVIVVGRAPTCDIRLHADTIRQFHCAIVQTPQGILVRPIQGTGGTTVNGKAPEPRPLHDGDEIAFGPFRFCIQLAEGEGSAGPDPVDQTPPTAEATVRIEATQLEQMRKAVEAEQLQAKTERRRLVHLRLRLRQRLHRHWAAERAVMRQREAALAADRRKLDQQIDRMQQERQDMYRGRLQANGEIELDKRKLRDAWNQLEGQQAAAQEQRTREQSEAAQRQRQLDQREIDLTDAERQLADERRRWETARVKLEAEVDGLEARIRNQRRKLLAQDEEIRRRDDSAPSKKEEAADVGVVVAPVEPVRDLPASETEIQRQLAELDRLSSDLSDQRLYLAEQCARLNVARRRWQQERDAAAAALEPLAAQLEERDRNLGQRERGLVEREAEFIERQQQLAQQRQFLDAWQGRLSARAALWEGERERLLEALRTREEKAETRLAAVAQIRRRWLQQRTQEIERVQSILGACEQLRKECNRLRDDWLKRGRTLDQERRTLAERTLALEEYRLAFVGEAENAGVVEQRLRKLRARWSREFEAALQPLVRERHDLAADWEHIREETARLRKDLAGLATREEDLSRRETEYEHDRARTHLEREALRGEMLRYQAHAEVYERQLRHLNEEVERLARAMLDENVASAPIVAMPRAA